MKKKLLLLGTCFFLCSMITAFFIFHTRQSVETIKNEKITEEVVNENNNNNSKKNDDVIINEDDKTSQVTMNILLFLVTGILLFFWENDKNIEKLPAFSCNRTIRTCKEKCIFSLKTALYGHNLTGTVHGEGLFSKYNWFGFATLMSLIVITFLVEFVLIGSISYLFSKDKNKRYFHTLKMSWKKRIQIFSSFSKTKTFFIVFSYLLYAFVIVLIAKLTPRCCKIIKYHHANCCCCCCTPLNVLKDN